MAVIQEEEDDENGASKDGESIAEDE